MAFKSKYKGFEIENLLDKISEGGDGITIVDSVDQLDPSAELGSLVSVVEPGSITETLISELPQPDSSIINMDTGFIDATSCTQVSGLSIIVPEGPIPVSMELTESEMLYFCSESVDLMNMTTGIMLGVFPVVVNNEIIALAGMYMNVTTMEQKELLLFQIQDGVVSVDQTAIDECNAYIKDLHYIGAMPYVMEGLSLTTEQLIIYDKVVKVVAGIPSKAHVYLKKDNWEELYAKDFEKLSSDINKLDTGLNDLDAKIPTKVSQLQNDSFYIPLKKKSIIKTSSTYIILEDNTETHIKQCVLSGVFEICIGSINRATLYIPVELGTVIRVTDVMGGYTLLQKSFDCGLIKFEFQNIGGTISINYTSIPQVRIDYIFKLAGSDTIYINTSGGALNQYYLNGSTIGAGGNILGEGEHHFTMISDISAESEVKYYGGADDYVILGPSFVTKIILGNGIKNLPKIQNCPLLAEIQLPQSLKYAKDYGGYFSNTPLLQYISVYTTDMLFRMSVGYSSSNTPGSRGLFSNGKKLKRYDDLYGFKPLVAPSDVRVALEGIWDGIEGLSSNQGIIYPNGLLSAGVNCMGYNVPFIAIPRNTNICDISFQLENYGGSYSFLYNKYLAYIDGNSRRQDNGFLFKNQFSFKRINSLTIERSFSEHLFRGINIETIYLKTKTVPEYAFSHSTVNNVYLENTVTIENGAFANCSNITKLELPDTLESIREYAFNSCASLNCLDFSKSTMIPFLGQHAFSNISSSYKIIVPDALYDEWIAATNWSTYADYIIKKSDWDVQQVSE